MTDTILEASTPALLRSEPLRALTPQESQTVYRACLAALAEPGRAFRIDPRLIPSGYPLAVAPLLALTDLMTTTAGCRGAEWLAREASDLAGAPLVALETARFVLGAGEPTAAELDALCAGTPLDPQRGAMLILQTTPPTPDDLRLTLRGPGIKTTRSLTIGGLSSAFFEHRSRLVQAPPTGIDLLLGDESGDIIGIPRTTQITVQNPLGDSGHLFAEEPA